MADVTATFAAKDQGVAATIQRLENKLAGFQTRMGAVSVSAKKMQSSFSNLGRSVIGLAGAYIGVSAAINSFNKALDMGGRLNELSQSTGETAGNLAVLERAFENAGVGGDRVGPMIAKMSNFIGELAKGSETASTVANRLGISLSDLRGKTPTQQMQILLRAIAGVADETTRMDLSGEVFGNRMGYKLIPLANNFAAELANARGELGSLPAILDKNAASLDELGDKLKNSVGNKLTELTIGFLAGVQGANDLANALSKVDAAGAGLDLGKVFSGAMQEPGAAFVAFGETLLLGVKKAGNELINATMYAAEVYANALSSPKFWSAISSTLAGAFGLAVNALTRMLMSAFKTAILKPLASLPTLMGGGIYKALLDRFEGLQGYFDGESRSFMSEFTGSFGKMRDLVLETSANTQKINKDFLGVAQQANEAATAIGALREAGTKDADAPAQKATQAAEGENAFAESLQRSNGELEKRNKLMQQSAEQFAKQYASQGDLGAFNYANMTSWQKKYMDALAFQRSQQPMIPPMVQSSSPQEQASTQQSSSLATETTLQKVAKFLEELNTKLPQPVLV